MKLGKTRRHGDTETRRQRSPRRRVAVSPRLLGFTLLELIITLSVLSILVMGTIPLAQNANKRQKELRLRETLRDIRNAIDEFKRDTLGACPLGAISNETAGGISNLAGATGITPDPRSRVIIDDCTIFDNENLDRYPPSLEILVEGVNVKPRGMNMRGGGGLGNDKTTVVFGETGETDEKKKVYLREMPVDPITGESNWRLRSSYQTGEAGNWDDINVFDIRSASDEEAFNGEKYSDW